MDGNGSVKLAYWIMGALLGVVMLLGGAAVASVEGRVSAVENIQKQRTDTFGELLGDIRILKDQVCRLQERVDDLREEVTHKRVYRHPCP